jgi:hypothetical protein
MSTNQQRPGEGWVRMQARRLGLGRSPLRRRVDRVEALLRLGTVMLALLMIPVAVGLGTAVRDASEHAAAERRAELQQVRAQALEDAFAGTSVVPGQISWPIRVAWQDAQGVERQGIAEGPVGTRAGADVTIWLDPTGRIVAPPRQPGDSTALGVSAGLGAVIVSWLALSGLFVLARRPLDRRRADDVDREWAEVSRRWTGRTDQQN